MKTLHLDGWTDGRTERQTDEQQSTGDQKAQLNLQFR